MFRKQTSITFETKKEIAAILALLQLFENSYNKVPSPDIDSELVNILLELNSELKIMKDLFFK